MEQIRYLPVTHRASRQKEQGKQSPRAKGIPWAWFLVVGVASPGRFPWVWVPMGGVSVFGGSEGEVGRARQ